MHVEKRENAIVNRLNKTKVEKFPDLREEKEARLKELGKRDRDAQQARVCSFILSVPAQFLPSPLLLSTPGIPLLAPLFFPLSLQAISHGL